MVIFDIESDGLLDNLSKIHCIVALDTDKPNTLLNFAQDKVGEGVKFLQDTMNNGGTICGHNIIKFDIPAIQKLYPEFRVIENRVLDSLVLSRLVASDISTTDFGRMKKSFPKKLYGSHSLEAWGYRLGEYKDDYKDRYIASHPDYQQGDEWKYFSEDMLSYCGQDVRVTYELVAKLLSKRYPQHKLSEGSWIKCGEAPISPKAVELEHQIAFLMAKQERNGFVFKSQDASQLYAKLSQKRLELEEQCRQLFKPWKVRLPDFTPKVNNAKLGYVKGVTVQRYKTVEFNPRSRDHIANRLQLLYGWKPTELTETGKPKVDEQVLSSLPYPPCPILAEYMLVQKRISQIAEGTQAWLKCVKADGRIHGSVNPNGAVTGRATHSYPNVSQVPANGSPYGIECRSLFTVPDGWTLVGCDASGLELRCLGHFMAKYDAGHYAELVVNGKKEEGTDIHTVNQKAAGLPTRDNAKTFIYGFLYGAGDEKIGSIVHGTSKDGKRLREKFLKSLPALKSLSEMVKLGAKRGYIVGLDGRHVTVRSEHAALNTLLQSAGALVCKKWLVLLEQTLQDKGLKHGWDGDYCFCAWSHDECQVACRTKEIAQQVGNTALECITKAGEAFNFKCRLDGEAKYGLTWADTH